MAWYIVYFIVLAAVALTAICIAICIGVISSAINWWETNVCFLSKHREGAYEEMKRQEKEGD